MRRLPPTEQLIGPAVLLAVVLTCAACGRSAPTDNAAADTAGAEPEIAGVVITSPDTVVPTGPGAPVAPASTTTSPPAAPVTVGVYTVQSGDTLSIIASRYGITTSALAAANAIVDIHSIKPGQELVIPPPVEGSDPGSGPDPGPAPSSTSTGGSGPEPTIIRPQPVDPGATTSLRQP